MHRTATTSPGSPPSPKTDAFDFDVAVLGGGPAGAAAAAALARAGRRVVLFERDSFPRFHIGESLLATVNDFVAELGVTEQVARRRISREWGASFMTADGSVERYADFGVARGDRRSRRPGRYRARAFDELLLEHAGGSGAEVREGHRVARRAVRRRRRDGRRTRTPKRGAARGARVAGGGRRHRPARRAGAQVRPAGARAAARRTSRCSRTTRGVPRPEGRRSGDIRIVARADLGWFWLIPIDDDLMSVGVVLRRAVFDAAAAPAARASCWRARSPRRRRSRR